MSDLTLSQVSQEAASIAQGTIDRIIPVTYTSVLERGPDGELNHKLSQLSEWVIDAACYLQQDNPGSSLVIAGERTFRGRRSTGDMMVDRARERGVPDYLISSLDGTRNLRNTPLQMKKLAKSISEGKNVVAVGMDYHLPRVGVHAEEAGLKLSELRAAEDILDDMNYDGELPDPEIMKYFADQEDKNMRLYKLVPWSSLWLQAVSLLNGPRLDHVQIHPVTKVQRPISTTSRKYQRDLKRSN